MSNDRRRSQEIWAMSARLRRAPRDPRPTSAKIMLTIGVALAYSSTFLVEPAQKRFSKQRIIGTSLLVMALAALSFVAAPIAVLCFVPVFAFYFFFGISYPTLLGLFSGSVSQADQGWVMGVSTAVFCLAGGVSRRGRLQALGRRARSVAADLVHVSQAPLRIDPVAHRLLQHANVRKAAVPLALPDKVVAEPDLEDSAGARHQRDRAERAAEGREQLLRHPAGPQQPLALRAVGDADGLNGLSRHAQAADSFASVASSTSKFA
jgi:hypothetical protein